MSKVTLEVCATELRRRYLAHEITADEFAALSEDIECARGAR